MGFVESIETCFRKYFDFRGRARRSEYWWFFLFTTVSVLVLWCIDLAMFESSRKSLLGDEPDGLFTYPFSDTFTCLTTIPSISAGARRLHDIGRSGWYQLMVVLPCIPILVLADGPFETLFATGAAIAIVVAFFALVILLVVWLATNSQAGHNKFGPSPK